MFNTLQNFLTIFPHSQFVRLFTHASHLPRDRVHLNEDQLNHLDSYCNVLSPLRIHDLDHLLEPQDKEVELLC